MSRRTARSAGGALAALLLALAAPLAAQQDATSAATVEVTPATLELDVDESAALRAAARTADGAAWEGSLRWMSSDPAVATVSDGVVTAVAPGRTRIVAVAGQTPGFANVVVRPLPAARLEVETPMNYLPAGLSLPLRVRAFDRLDGVVEPGPITWSSSDPAIARIDAHGRVHGVRAGEVTLTARVGDATGSLPLTVQAFDRAGRFSIAPAQTSVRTGDVVRFSVESPRFPVFPAWSVSGAGAQIEAEGREGVFVAETPGSYVVTARLGDEVLRTARVEVAPREYESELVQVGRGPIASHHSGDMWVFEGVDGRDYVYVGTFMHDWAKVWDVTDPEQPVLTDSIQLDARRINDVKIHPNNRLGILTREGASSRRNGIVLLDLADPAHPEILSEYTETVTGGVHNVWIDGENELVYAAHNGTSAVHILDISDPRDVREVGRWGLDKPVKTLHDVIVQDGYLYASYWDDGIVMLDVGAGTHGGTPTEPAFVSRYAYPIGSTHVAWRDGRYLFVGDEIFPAGWDASEPIHARGYIHVIDYLDPENPVEVAKYEVPEAGAHNIWVEDGKLYVGYYQAGLRVVDVTGELRGDLYAQGREIAHLIPTDEHSMVPNWPMTWGAQIFKGRIYSSDLNSGIWITRLQGDERVVF